MRWIYFLVFNTTLPKQICLKIRNSNHSLRKCEAINLLVFLRFWTQRRESGLFIDRAFISLSKNLNTIGRNSIIYTDCNQWSVTILKTVEWTNIIHWRHAISCLVINTLRTGPLNCLNARSRVLNFRHRASCI